MELALILLIVVIVLTLMFDYINGFHDAANAIATVVSTRVLNARQAIAMGAILNFAGALTGTKVAATIGSGLVDISAISIVTVTATVLAAIIWNLITWYKGLPTSSSHALIGSLIGASFVSSGASTAHIHIDKFYNKVFLPMIGSPLLGITTGFIIMALLTRLAWKWKLPTINKTFGKLQIVSAGFMAFNHGLNDAQKSMGIIALAIMLTYQLDEFSVPLWVKLVCALFMGLGTAMGGWRIIRTLGTRVIQLQPIHGFAAETTASLIIFSASQIGMPVSTTHVISTSIMGVGATKRISAVRWGIVGRIVWAWILTLPLTFILAALLMLCLKNITPL